MKALLFGSISLCILIVSQSCASINPNMKLVYTDQNNNYYTITRNKIDYKAIKPKESSSGIYSGGTDKTVKISSTDFKKLTSISELLIQEKNNHSIRREMMTSELKRSLNGKNERVILKNSENRAAFELLLKKFLKN